MHSPSPRTVGTASLLAAVISVVGLAGGVAQAAPAHTAPASGSIAAAPFIPPGCRQSITTPEFIDKYISVGGKDVLGCPTTGEMSTPDGKAQFMHFQDDRTGADSAIYVIGPRSTPSRPAFLITDRASTRGHGIFTKWRNSGFERGSYGYPTQDAVDTGAGYSTQQFQGGSLDNR